MQKLIGIPAVLLVTIWYSHIVHTELGTPLGRNFDFALEVASKFLKIATIVAIVVMLRRAFIVMHDNRNHAIRAGLSWAVSGIACLVLASLTRELWAPILTGPAVKMYWMSCDFPFVVSSRHFHRWRWCWSHGIVTIVESVVLVAIVVTNAWIAYRWGNKVKSVVLGIAVAIGTGFVYVIVSGWVLLDFDFFHGDIIVSSILADTMFFPLTIDAYTSIAAAVYLLTTCILLLTNQIAKPAENGEPLSGDLLATTTDSTSPYTPPSHG